MVIGSVRHASYSKNPQMKDGSLRALIYNDALYKGKTHLLSDSLNPNQTGKIAPPASWKIEARSSTAVVEPRGYENALTVAEKYALPEHQHQFMPNPFLGCRGGKINQRIRYEELLPTCAGKLSKLEWSHLTEEDRYTKRNHVIRMAQRRNEETADITGMDDYAEGAKGNVWKGYRTKLMLVLFSATIWAGWPGTNSRSMNGIDPNNESQTHMDESWFAKIPILGPLVLDLFFHNSPAFPLLDGMYGNTTSKVQCVPLWAESSADVRSMSGSERGSLHCSSITHNRDLQHVPHVPSANWRENNTLYLDDAEGPDRIGNYNVHPWKTGTTDSYQNAKMSGDTVDGYHPNSAGAADPLG